MTRDQWHRAWSVFRLIKRNTASVHDRAALLDHMPEFREAGFGPCYSIIINRWIGDGLQDPILVRRYKRLARNAA